MRAMTYRGTDRTQILKQIRAEHGENVSIIAAIDRPDRTVEIKIALDLAEESVGSAEHASESPPTSRDEYVRTLYRHGLAPQIIQAAISRAQHGQSGDACALISAALGDFIECNPSLTRTQDGPRVVALVGPTGVGKTTTIAKLAARMRATFNTRIGLISADSYRIGAGQQLRTYADLLRVPCRSTQDSSLEQIVSDFRLMELILVDTAGCSPRDSKRINDLDSLFGKSDQVERMLVLAAPSNERDLARISHAFAPTKYSRIIVTKLDESGYLGPIANVAASVRKPCAFFCTGQRVPEDIEPATQKRLAWMLTAQIH